VKNGAEERHKAPAEGIPDGEGCASLDLDKERPAVVISTDAAVYPSLGFLTPESLGRIEASIRITLELPERK